jgi:DtxR family Mn-dependent transcriptional regulator
LKLTISKEDYVKAVAEAEAESDQPVSSAVLRRRLSVSAPAVSAALRRLSRDRLVRIDSAGAIHLTAKGREITVRLLRRHYLIERMLTEVFSMEWYKVHEEAERLEHAVSDDFERRLIHRLGTTAPCPHGHDMESRAPAERRRRGWRLLGELNAQESGNVVAVYERDRALLEYLDHVGLRPGVLLLLASRNVDDTLTLQVGGKSITVGASIGSRVWVSADAEAAIATSRPRRSTEPVRG